MSLSISIIIPSGPAERAIVSLANDLAGLENDIEIILVHCENENPVFWSETKQKIQWKLAGKNVRWISTSQGRAHQLNTGAAQASGSFLWFLHADSVLGNESCKSLRTALYNQPHAMHYFKLAFTNDGPTRLMRLNEAAVHMRSKLIRMPFGDQGFCIAKSVFESMGGFPENLPYGEDHVFVWKLHHAGIPIKGIRVKLLTSARKYASNGWLKTSFTHNKLWIKQAIPQAMKYFQSRGIL